ncbi:MAG: hypothetical protein ACR2MK_05805, partial [Solirubrobacteraceae bacterium]
HVNRGGTSRTADSDNGSLLVWPRQRSRVRLRLLALLLIGAVGLALIIVGLGGATGWLLIAPGFAALLVALPGIYLLRRSEIEDAAKAIGRSRRISLRRDQPE